MQTLDRLMMVLAVLVGILSLVFFVTVWPAGLIDLRWPWWAALGGDAVLSFVFFLQHSGMVRRPFRAWLARCLPARYGGAIYSIASGVVLVGVAALWQPAGVPLLTLHGAGVWITRGAAVFALAVAAWGFWTLRSVDLFGAGAIRAHLRGVPEQKAPFRVQGPYRWVRHPLYACVLIVIWAYPNVTADRLLFNVLWSAWVIVATVWEERDLVADFGDAYRDYQRRVPMLCPWPGRVAPPDATIA